jgi:hypothetical protein
LSLAVLQAFMLQLRDLQIHLHATFLVNTSQWSNLMSLNDSGRPIYNEVTKPSNAGSVTPIHCVETLLGLDLYVTANTAATTDTDDSMLIINPDAYTWYEGTSYQLRAESIADGSITVGVYSFGAVHKNRGRRIRRK